MAFQKNGKGFKELFRILSVIIYNYPGFNRDSSFTEDDRGDFLLYLHPSLKTVLRKFSLPGHFERYFKIVLKWQFHNYRRTKDTRQYASMALNKPGIWELPVEKSRIFNPETSLIEWPRVFDFNTRGEIKREAEKKQFLIFALKSCRKLSPVELKFISMAAGVEYEWLETAARSLKATMTAREKRYAHLVGQKNYTFLRKRILEESLRFIHHAAKNAKAKRKIEMLNKRFRKMYSRVEQVPLCPTNKTIASLTGLSKGTIDSSIYLLKRKIYQAYSREKNLQKAPV